MSFEAAKRTIEDNLDPMAFGHALYDSAVRQPVNAIKQLTGHSVSETHYNNEDTLAAKAGNLAGFIVDFTLLSKATGGVINPLLGKAADGVVGASSKMLVAGSIYGGILTPSSNDRSLLEGRLENAAVSGATFAIMGGAGKALENTSLFKTKSLLNKVATNAIAGGAGGIADAYGSVYVAEHRLASPEEVLSDVGRYAAFGAGFGALDFGMGKAAERLAKIPAVGDAKLSFYFAKENAKVEAKRLTYSILNKTGLDHPWQNLGDMLNRSDSVSDRPRLDITHENNPVRAFEKELPRYFDEISQTVKAQEDLDRTDYGGWSKINDQQKEIGTDFAYQLVRLWNGTADQPGIAQYTDTELATPEISAERVGEIRKVLSLSASAGNLMTGLAKLANVDISSHLEGSGINSRYENYALCRDEIGSAKEKFFHYGYQELQQRMKMPSELYSVDRDDFTPKEWMPHQANEQLPNLFHGSGSPSFPSLLRERTMWPSAELKLRGIPLTSGECIDYENDRRDVSISRNFNVAWSYARLSNNFISGYPAMFGISADVAPRTWTLLSEPGEIRIDKLRLGESALTKLGLRKPEITHLYVPDSQVESAQAQLAARRVKGVSVIGFDQLRAPQWNSAPTGIEYE